MPNYMLLLYAQDLDDADQAARWGDMPEWLALTRRLRETGLLVSNGTLHGVDVATTVRVRGRDTELTDGPFAVTKEVLVGYYVLECDDLDVALEQAAWLPTARYGSVEIRPVMDLGEIPNENVGSWPPV